MLMCNHKIRINLMRCLRISTARCEIGQYTFSNFYRTSLKGQESMKLEIRDFNLQFIFMSTSQELVDTS